MSEALEIYVLDTSAWLTLIEDEAGADSVEELIEKARAGEIVVLISFMSFMEVYSITMQERDGNEVQARVDLMAALPGLRVDSTEALGLLAGELKLSTACQWLMPGSRRSLRNAMPRWCTKIPNLSRLKPPSRC
jgi:PIN domain nuclease of toxin-antitoxin system